ncbi:uncharacterized protein METZ01_LOCUS425151, partial [marine metagenome]
APLASPVLVTPNLGTPSAITLTNATYPTGTVENVAIYKYAMDTNASYTHNSDTYTMFTRASDTDATAQNISVVAGYTYLYEYQWWHVMWRKSGSPDKRRSVIHLREGTTDHSQGASDPAGNILARFTVGFNLVAGSSVTAAVYHLTNMAGAKYYTTSETRYVWLDANADGGELYYEGYMSATNPMYLRVSKIKGDALNIFL